MEKLLRINMSAEGGPAAVASPRRGVRGAGRQGVDLRRRIEGSAAPGHPLGEDNKLVIAPGMLSGTIAAMSGRFSVGGKSPLTGGIKEANSGGQASQVLARLGYAAIILEGKPKENDLYKVFINKDGVKITRDNSLKMLANYDLVEKMKGEYGEKIACMSIGPAGEMKMCAATMAFTDMELRPTRHAGRGGLGAVMGSKGVKVIVLDDAGMSARARKIRKNSGTPTRRFVDGLKKHPVTGEGLPAFGTNVLDQHPQRGGRLPHLQLQAGAASSGRIEDQRRDRWRNWRRPAAATRPTAATAAASSVLRHLSSTRTATTSPSSPSTRPSGPTAATAASTTSTRSP